MKNCCTRCVHFHTGSDTLAAGRKLPCHLGVLFICVGARNGIFAWRAGLAAGIGAERKCFFYRRLWKGYGAREMGVWGFGMCFAEQVCHAGVVVARRNGRQKQPGKPG